MNRALKIRIGLLTAILLAGVIISCRRRDQSSSPSSASPPPSNFSGRVGFDFTNAYIAIGSLVTNRTDDSVGVAHYRVREAVRGAFRTNDIWVSYWADTCAASVPTDAVLVVTPFGGHRDFAAIGMDARFGILSNAPAALSRVRTSTSDELAPSPQSNWLDKAAAIALANKYTIGESPGASQQLHLGSQTRRICRVDCGRKGVF